MRVGDPWPLLAGAANAGRDRPVRAAPAEDEQVRALLVVDLELGDVGGDPGDLARADPHHQVVVVGVVGDVARALLLLQPADPVLEAGRAGERPLARERAVVAHVREETVAVVRLGGELERDVGQVGDVRDEPRLGAVGEVGVGEQEDRRAVLERDPRGLDRHVEAVAGSRRGEHRDRRLGVAAEHDHEQVGLLRLRRHPCRRSGPLDVEDDERQLERDRKPDRLRLEDDARAARRRDAERAAEGRAERGADGGDLVLRLEGAHAEVLVPRQLLEDPGGGRDRVGAEEERQPALHARGDEAHGERLVPGDVAVGARARASPGAPRTGPRTPRSSRRRRSRRGTP